MKRSCDFVYGGIHCGRTAKAKAGVFIPPHRPTSYEHLCDEHLMAKLTRVELLDDPEVMVEVIRL